MALQIIPDVGNTKAEALQLRAVALLDEMCEESGRAYAVASAGRAFVGPDGITERYLFEVIEGILENALLPNTLREVIGELAQLAGSTCTQEMQEAAHG